MTRPADDERFRRHFETHRDDIWRYCRRRVPPSEVDDAVADVFVVVWRRLDEVPAGDGARLWLYGIARNVVRNRQRADRRRDRLTAKLRSVDSGDVPSAELMATEHADRAGLTAAVDRLDPDDRELLRLRTWEELSLAEIAEVTGRSVRSVESRLARLRKRLARSIDHAASRPAAVRAQGAADDDHPMWLSPTRRQGGAR